MACLAPLSPGETPQSDRSPLRDRLRSSPYGLASRLVGLSLPAVAVAPASRYPRLFPEYAARQAEETLVRSIRSSQGLLLFPH